MSIQLGNKKRSVTRHITSLKELIKKIREAKAEQRDEPADGADEVYLSTKSTLLNENICALKTSADRLDEALSELCTFADEMDDQSDDLIASIDKYITDSHDLLATARDHLTLLQARLHGVKEERSWRNKVLPTHDPQLGDGLAPVHDTTINTSAEVRPRLVELPTIPIPKFSGEIWEWENFWALFKSNVHDLEITALQKYNYLLHALKGDAKEAVARFQICAANYPKAIALLTAKYAKKDSLVRNLLARLDSSRATGPNIKDQRRLLDQLSVIISQLDTHNEVNNGTWVLTKTLAKFSEAIQRKVLNKRVALPATTAWDVTLMMNTIEEVIAAEETVQELMAPMRDYDSDSRTKFDKHGKMSKEYADNRGNSSTNHSDDNATSKKDPGKPPACLYCGGAHYSAQCSVMVTIAQRTRFLTENDKCLVCTSKFHTTADCTRSPCRICGKQHHSTICPTRQYGTGPSKPVDTNKDTYPKKDTPFQKTTSQQKSTTAFVSEEFDHVLQTSTNQQDETQYDELPTIGRSSKVLLLTGQAQVMDPATQQLKMIDVLLDTGSELSFVDNKLADELQLETAGSVSLNIHTFGSTKTTKKRSDVKSLRIWDRKGTPHDLRVHTNDVLTSSLPRATLGTQDVQFIKKNDIQLSMNCTTTRIRPRVLIGSDQLWTLMNTTSGLFTLPSGLILVPTLLGYMLTGKECKTVTRTEIQSTATHIVALNHDKRHFDQLWRMEGDDSDDESIHTHAWMVTHADTVDDPLTDHVTEKKLDDHVEMADGTELVAEVTNPLQQDIVRFDNHCRLRGAISHEDEHVTHTYMAVQTDSSDTCTDISTIAHLDHDEHAVPQPWDLDTLANDFEMEPIGSQRSASTETTNSWSDYEDTDLEGAIERCMGRFYVRFQWKLDKHILPDNRLVALTHLKSIYAQLRQQDLLESYDAAIRDQLDKGIIEMIHDDEPPGQVHYLPHDPCVLTAAESTQLRVLFHTCAQYQGRPSMQDLIHNGPYMLEAGCHNRHARLLQEHTSADGSAQFHIHENDQDMTRFLWLKDCTFPPGVHNIQQYRFTQLTLELNIPAVRQDRARNKNQMFWFYGPEFQHDYTMLDENIRETTTDSSHISSNDSETFNETRHEHINWRTRHPFVDCLRFCRALLRATLGSCASFTSTVTRPREPRPRPHTRTILQK